MTVREHRLAAFCILAVIFLTQGIHSANAQQILTLTLDKAVDIAMENSYRIKYLQMGIERNRYYLKARQASLKSRV